MLSRTIAKAKQLSPVKRAFGLLNEYQERAGIKTQNNVLMPEKPQFYVTPTRPGNFGEHIDYKVNIDDFFEQNRVYNEAQEETTGIRRTQHYLINAVFYGALLSFARVYAMMYIQRLSGWTRYDKDTYAEFNIGAIPPGEVIQVSWNGTPVFIRRLTAAEVKDENELPTKTLLDTGNIREVSPVGRNSIVIHSAVCTHLGCIPIPYLGVYEGYVCVCHGSVYDKFGRVRQGPALQNLPGINNSIHGENQDIVCMEELKYSREPSARIWA